MRRAGAIRGTAAAADTALRETGAPQAGAAAPLAAEGRAHRPAESPHLTAPGPGNPDLPALTGLRFCAAFFVVLGHAQTAFVAFSPQPALLAHLVSALISTGMSLFFVLSGFVIHYNYHPLLRAPSARGLATFYTARFARLYPLFLFFTLMALGFHWNGSDWLIAPFYLALAQSWTYLLIGGSGLLSLTHVDITWSISTEWFFYCCYPLIAWLLGRTTRRRGLAILGAVTLGCMALLAFAYRHQGDIAAFAEARWGAHATAPGNDSFFSWLVWFSPGRIAEFLCGVIAAEAFLAVRARPVGAAERRLGAAALTAAIAALALIHAVLQRGGAGFATAVAASPVVVPTAIAVVLFCCARYRSLLARALSTNALILCGEASYSIYLLHVPVMQATGPGVVLPLNRYFALYAGVRFALTAVLLIVASIGFYRALERPARAWIRRALADRGAVADRIIVTGCIGVPVLAATIGWLLSLGLPAG